MLTDMNIETVFGILATAGSLLVASLGIFAQIRKNYKTKSCGMDPLYISLICTSYALWTLYAIVKKDIFIFLPHLVGLFLASIVIYQLIKYKKSI